jgi:hypothetical protein
MSMHFAPRDTELAAAASMRPHTERLRDRVLALLRDHPDGLTDDEGGELLDHSDRLTFGRRRHDLMRLGLVIASGRRRSTPSGRKAIVWRLRRPDE